MPRLIDADVIVRVVLSEADHPGYMEAIGHLHIGGVVRDYVMPEIVFQFLANYKFLAARYLAKQSGDLDVFENNKDAYLRTHSLPAGWKKEAYSRFKRAMQNFLLEYSQVEIEKQTLFNEALCIACSTGYDWVDCMLLAEKNLNGCELASLDRDVRKGVKPMSLL